MHVETGRAGGHASRCRRLLERAGLAYVADVPDTRPVQSFTPRVLPALSDALVPLELPMVVWASRRPIIMVGPTRQRTTTTGTLENSRITDSATLPKRARATPLRP